MEASVRLGKIWGIPIGLHGSWFLIFALLTWSLAQGYFPAEYPQLSSASHWILGLLTSILFFGSVLAHELGHALLALRNRIPVKSITLFIFGGVAQIGQEPRSPGTEFRIAIAGPLVSLALAALFGVLWFFDQYIVWLAAPSLYLARINLILAVFNMIPGFPLDGGRVLRAMVWAVTRNFRRATKIASYSGQLVAFGFIGVGVFTLLQGQLMNGLWLAFIGWFLQNAAGSALAQVQLQHTLRDVQVGQVMARNSAFIPANTVLSQLVEGAILGEGQRTFFVTDNGQGYLRGLVTLKDVTAVPRDRWEMVTAGQVMLPLERLSWVNTDTSLLQALQMMDEANVAQLPVMEGNRVVGLLTRDQVLHYIRLRSEIGV